MVNLYWTGGFDSTVRLAQLLMAGEEVQPIYLRVSIDVRRSQTEELAAMAALSPELRVRFPQARLRDIRVVDEIPAHPELTRMARAIGYGPDSRFPMGAQYEALCRYAETLGQTVEIGIEIGGRAERLLRRHVTGHGGHCRVDVAALRGDDRLLQIFRRLRFPLIHLTKPELAEIGENLGIRPLLDRTWSCWYPSPASGEPCGRCEMCRHRVVRRPWG